MVENFISCGKFNGTRNKVFEYCWKQQIETSAIRTVKDVSFDSVYKQVWNPAITQCQSLLSGLNDKTATLKEVESLYQIENFSLQLSALYDAMCRCYPNCQKSRTSSNEWIPKHITLYYHEIANNYKCSEAAGVILKVKSSLKLEGNFKIIEDLAHHVRM